MKVISFNANGIRSAARKGFYDWLAKQNADFVCIQETKAQMTELEADPVFFPAEYHCDFVDAEKKGYSGVALYARQKPNQVIKGFGYPLCDAEGRYVQFDYDEVSVVSLYLPSGSSGAERQAVKFEFLDHLAQHLKTIKQSGREFILCGDYNIAHKIIDIKNWRGNQKNSGFLPEERAWMDNLFGDMGFVDAFRVKNQQAEQYTWWSNRGQAWAKNVGWRIDYQVITPGLLPHVAEVAIYLDQRFSDHAPLVIDYRTQLS